MSSTAQLLQAAVQLHQRGDLAAARKIYEQVCQLEPRNAPALNLLGMIARQTGQFDESVRLLRQAISIDPMQAAYFANLGEAYRGLGKIAEAIDCYGHAVRLQPGAFETHNNLGTLLQQAGMLEAAIASYRNALRVEPHNGEGHFNLGTALQRQGKHQAAAESYRQALERNPNQPSAWINLGTVIKLQGKLAEAEPCFQRAIALQGDSLAAHFGLGNLYQEQNRFDEAVACYQRAQALQPDHADTLCNLGNALREQEKFSEALGYLEKAVQLNPDLAAAHSNLGVTLQDLARLSEAQRSLERAVQLAPGTAVFHYNLGTVLRDQGHPAAAIACFEESSRLDPVYAQPQCSRGMALLSMGHFSAGWPGYECRVRCPQFDTRTYPQPLWNGTPLADRTLLIHSEQGLGDTLQFIRYAQLAYQRGERIIVAAPRALLPLLAQSGYRGLISRDDPLPAFDVHAALLSLPHIFRTEVDTVPNDVPYLQADEANVAHWREELKRYSGRKVGIAWQGQKTYRGDRLRSVPLEAFLPLAEVAGVRLLSLQKGYGSEQLAALGDPSQIVDLGALLDHREGAFLDTAAVMKNLDLVITSDTAIAHLAGALAVPVWVALSAAPDWRWLLKREDSPWYPTMRLFRQSQLGQWSDVFARLAEELAKRAAAGDP